MKKVIIATAMMMFSIPAMALEITIGNGDSATIADSVVEAIHKAISEQTIENNRPTIVHKPTLEELDAAAKDPEVDAEGYLPEDSPVFAEEIIEMVDLDGVLVDSVIAEQLAELDAELQAEIGHAIDEGLISTDEFLAAVEAAGPGASRGDIARAGGCDMNCD